MGVGERGPPGREAARKGERDRGSLQPPEPAGPETYEVSGAGLVQGAHRGRSSPRARGLPGPSRKPRSGGGPQGLPREAEARLLTKAAMEIRFDGQVAIVTGRAEGWAGVMPSVWPPAAQ